jgi:hypothetical protein
MPKPKDSAEVVATIKESIEASPRKSRKVRFHNLRSQFGWQVWTVRRKELVAQLLKDEEILAQPSLADAGLDDWIMLSMPIITNPSTKDPVPPPDDEFFRRLMSVHLGPEREVEVNTSLGYFMLLITMTSMKLTVSGSSCMRASVISALRLTSFTSPTRIIRYRERHSYW